MILDEFYAFLIVLIIYMQPFMRSTCKIFIFKNRQQTGATGSEHWCRQGATKEQKYLLKVHEII